MSNLCVVGCKVPMGLILELGRRGDPEYKSVTLKGSNHGKQLASGLIVPEGVNSYGLTHGVDRGFVEAWLKKNAALDLVRNKQIFIAKDDTEAQAMAIGDGRKTGLEALNPADMPAGLEPDKEHMAMVRAATPRIEGA